MSFSDVHGPIKLINMNMDASELIQGKFFNPNNKAIALESVDWHLFETHSVKFSSLIFVLYPVCTVLLKRH